MEASYAVVGIDFCQNTRQIMLTQFYPAKDHGVGTYMTCPSNEAKKALNTAIFQITETFNYLYSDASEAILPHDDEFGKYPKRNNSYYKYLIDKFKDDNWTILINENATLEYALDVLVNLIDYNHIVGDLK